MSNDASSRTREAASGHAVCFFRIKTRLGRRATLQSSHAAHPGSSFMNAADLNSPRMVCIASLSAGCPLIVPSGRSRLRGATALACSPRSGRSFRAVKGPTVKFGRDFPRVMPFTCVSVRSTPSMRPTVHPDESRTRAAISSWKLNPALYKILLEPHKSL
jgi:hypothetical protein